MILVYVERAGASSTAAGARIRARARRSGSVHASLRRQAPGLRGVETLHVAEHEAFAPTRPPRRTRTRGARRRLSAVSGRRGRNERGNEVLAHVAAQLDLPFAANCIAATPGDPMSSRACGGAEACSRRRGFTEAPNSSPCSRTRWPPSRRRRGAEVERFTPELSDADRRARRRARRRGGRRACRSRTQRSSSRAVGAQDRRKGSGSSRSSQGCSAAPSAARAR